MSLSSGNLDLAEPPTFSVIVLVPSLLVISNHLSILDENRFRIYLTWKESFQDACSIEGTIRRTCSRQVSTKSPITLRYISVGKIRCWVDRGALEKQKR